MPTTRAAIALLIPLALLACGIESRIAPRAPLAADPRCDVVATAPPPPAMHFDIPPPPIAPVLHARPARYLAPGTVSLGFIGDDPIGRYPTVPHRAPAWSRPFRGGWSSGYDTPTRHYGGYRR